MPENTRGSTDEHITVQQIAARTGRAETDSNVIAFVKATNAYRNLWPRLYKISQTHNGGREHLRLLKLENELYKKQSISGHAIGILATEPDMSRKA